MKPTKERGLSSPHSSSNRGLENPRPNPQAAWSMTRAQPSKAPTGRPYDSPRQRPGSNVPMESGALKGRNMGGAA